MSVRNIVILTGAGVSAESGLATFRGPDGLWEGHRVEDVCTPEAFARDPALVQAFYDARRAKLGTVQPNAAHAALARLDAEWPGDLLLVTQNVDDLHERAGSKRLIHMHGELASGWCLACGERFPWTGSMGEGAACPQCQCLEDIGATTDAAVKQDGNLAVHRRHDLRQNLQRRRTIIHRAPAVIGDDDRIRPVLDRQLGVFRIQDTFDQ